jgi:S-adenosylmethionine:tRNA ribosyltransferase-isomerase
MRAADFDYHLPPERIAQHPAPQRDASRLLTLDRTTGSIGIGPFSTLTDRLRKGDLLVFNDSRVIPARLRAIKEESGAQIELLLLEPTGPLEWWSMVRPGKRVRPGMLLRLQDRANRPTSVSATVLAKREDGHIQLGFQGTDNLLRELQTLGEIPLPPYIQRNEGGPSSDDAGRYQTVYARNEGSVAAPTAGLHFTPELLETIRLQGVETAFVTLHVGHGTFAPVKADQVEEHLMHEEWYEVPSATASAYHQAKAEGRRVIAVGTTSVRVLETVFRANGGKIIPGTGRTSIFIHPPQVVGSIDGLLTNFHLPQSTLLMLVSAFAAPGRHPEGRDLILQAYQEAIRNDMRFFSFGDAMLLI